MAKKVIVSNSKRMAREAQRRQAKNRKILTYSGIGVLVLAIIGGLIFLGTRPAAAAVGEEVTVGAADHVADGSDSGPYKTNPPTGGKHYASEYEAGFYDEATIANLPRNYEGYLVHNLEHGYIIYWYNCDADPSLSCDEIKQSIRDVMEQARLPKLIAFPWPSQEEPIVLTSWSRILRLDAIDKAKMLNFTKANYNQAPEPFAD